jgi:hypothetical protein
VERRRIEPGDGRKRVLAAEAVSAKTARVMCQTIYDNVLSTKHKQKEEVASAYLGTKASGLVQGELISASGEEGVHEIFRKILGEHRKLSNI